MRRVLIANRGEIAVRIIRACRERNLETVAVCSEADREARHVRAADRVVALGAAPAGESYLHIGRVIDAARSSGADAVHPGYGFLSENAAFAAACRDAGLTFIGPPAQVIETMGSKAAARRLAERAGVPVVPGRSPEDQSPSAIAAAARSVGLPVLIKASAGGGGRGMRAVTHEDTLPEAILSARDEAERAFGDGSLHVERLILRARHVEVQVLADAFGRVVHLFERECSLQRRHQKVVEESPSPALTPLLRRRLGAAAVQVARASGYVNAGTVEFLLEGEGDDASFHFLEMNTRLQVEHPVTEAVTGRDLVHAQMDVADGTRLRWRQQDVTARGHAIECRVYAEDPERDFLPQAGRLLTYREPSAPGVRVDGGVAAGEAVTVHYDPLLAKVIAWAETRDGATARLRAALSDFVVLGVPTNLAYLDRVLSMEAFANASLDTRLLEREHARLTGPGSKPDARTLARVAAVGAACRAHHRRPADGTTPDCDPWSTFGEWRLR